jgi:predicted RNase H-like HicB family nuclease
MTGKRVLRRLRHLGCEVVRQRGSRVRPPRRLRDDRPGARRRRPPTRDVARDRGDLEPWLGRKWLRVSYRVVIERDETWVWLARVPSVPGCHTYGRTLDQVRRRIREALELWIDDARHAELQFEIRLPTAIKKELHRARTTRDRSARAQSEASEAVWRAARDLTQKAGLSLRDAAELLELSHQRVQQVLSASTTGDRETRRRRARSA